MNGVVFESTVAISFARARYVTLLHCFRNFRFKWISDVILCCLCISYSTWDLDADVGCWIGPRFEIVITDDIFIGFDFDIIWYWVDSLMTALWLFEYKPILRRSPMMLLKSELLNQWQWYLRLYFWYFYLLNQLSRWHYHFCC